MMGLISGESTRGKKPRKGEWAKEMVQFLFFFLFFPGVAVDIFTERERLVSANSVVTSIAR